MLLKNPQISLHDFDAYFFLIKKNFILFPKIKLCSRKVWKGLSKLVHTNYRPSRFRLWSRWSPWHNAPYCEIVSNNSQEATCLCWRGTRRHQAPLCASRFTVFILMRLPSWFTKGRRKHAVVVRSSRSSRSSLVPCLTPRQYPPGDIAHGENLLRQYPRAFHSTWLAEMTGEGKARERIPRSPSVSLHTTAFAHQS